MPKAFKGYECEEGANDMLITQQWRMRLSDDHSLARGQGKGTVSQSMHDVQVKQIVIAAGETTEKVCMVTPRTRHLRGRAPRKLCTKLLLAWVT